jgi:thioredoxin-related protein
MTLRITREIVFAVLILAFCSGTTLYSQEKAKLYDPGINGEEQIATALEKAKQTNTNVIVQVGGNWCKWCHKLHKLFQSDKEIEALLKEKYQLVYLNYSKENKNSEVLKMLEHPERFGFPVLVVIDQHGKRLHTQDSALLEANGAHDRAKVLRFLGLWMSELTNGAKD